MAAAEHVLTAGSPAAAWSLEASELARAYAARELSPVEALEAVLDRTDQINPQLNAIVTFDFAGARLTARASEARWQDGCPLGPLDGVPVTVKDNIPVAGLRTTWGSPLFEHHVPTVDELPVARLRAQGAVIFGKTNVPEFTLQGYTDNPLFGPTRNPWDVNLTPGGSSGGAVAAVAAGLGPLALATDGGGSIRRPASHAGLIGFKPSTGRVARTDGLPVILHDFEVIGPIARTTADAALLYQAIAGGPEAHDRASLAFPNSAQQDLPDVSSLRVLYVPRFGDSPVDPEIRESVAEAARNLQTAGHEVEQGEVPFDLGAMEWIWSVVGAAGLAWMLTTRSGALERIGAPMRALAEKGAALSAADYIEALQKTTRLRARLADVFTQFDLVLTPSAAALPWPAEVSHPSVIDGKAVGPRGHAVFTAFANAAGLPGISIPCRPARSGLPIGMQLVGAFGADRTLLAVAAQYESAHPWADRWPPIG